MPVQYGCSKDQVPSTYNCQVNPFPVCNNMLNTYLSVSSCVHIYIIHFSTHLCSLAEHTLFGLWGCHVRLAKRTAAKLLFRPEGAVRRARGDRRDGGCVSRAHSSKDHSRFCSLKLVAQTGCQEGPGFQVHRQSSGNDRIFNSGCRAFPALSQVSYHGDSCLNLAGANLLVHSGLGSEITPPTMSFNPLIGLNISNKQTT